MRELFWIAGAFMLIVLGAAFTFWALQDPVAFVKHVKQAAMSGVVAFVITFIMGMSAARIR